MSRDNHNYELREQKIPKRRPDYRFRTVWCGVTGCGIMYNVQTDARNSRFVSASTYLKPGDKAQVIVPRCIRCGANLGDAWLDECLTAAPEPNVYRGGE